jgi:hypothetical protein
MTTVAITILLSGVLIFLLSLPMIYRKVPMNHFYGVRIPAAFESDRMGGDSCDAGQRARATRSGSPMEPPQRTKLIGSVRGGAMKGRNTR